MRTLRTLLQTQLTGEERQRILEQNKFVIIDATNQTKKIWPGKSEGKSDQTERA